MPKNVLISGGSGLVGTRLTEMLRGMDYQVAHLSRSTKTTGPVPTYQWDVDNQQMDLEPLRWADSVVHLAGAGVADKRWSAKRKQAIKDSRVMSTNLLASKLAQLDDAPLKSFVSASAIGYYGYGQETWFGEEDPVGDGFLAMVTDAWERAIDGLSGMGFKVVKLRIGVVLSERGGALKEIAKPVRWWAGAPLGTGNQYMSWIHIDDLCRMFITAIEDDTVTGVYNAVAPNPVTNRAITKSIAQVLGKPLILPPVPAFVMKLMLGEQATIVLDGARVSCDKIKSKGFKFNYTDAHAAITDLLGEA